MRRMFEWEGERRESGMGLVEAKKGSILTVAGSFFELYSPGIQTSVSELKLYRSSDRVPFLGRTRIADRRVFPAGYSKSTSTSNDVLRSEAAMIERKKARLWKNRASR